MIRFSAWSRPGAVRARHAIVSVIATVFCAVDGGAQTTNTAPPTVIVGSAGQSTPNPPKQTSFCKASETVLFSCSVGNKSASVCASQGTTKTTGYVQYRFGKRDLREPLEMIIPEGQVIANQAVTGENTPFAGGGGSWLRFRRANYSYVVYEGIGRWGPKGEPREKAGIVVEREGRMIANLKCTSRPMGELTPGWFEKMAVKPKRDEEFLFP